MNKEVSWQTSTKKHSSVNKWASSIRYVWTCHHKKLYDCMIPLDHWTRRHQVIKKGQKKCDCMKIPLVQPPPHGSNERSHRPALQICQALAPTHIWLFKKASDGRLLLLYFSFAQLHQHDQIWLLTCISLCVSLIILRGRAAIVRGGEERQAEGDPGFASNVWNPQTQVKNWS